MTEALRELIAAVEAGTAKKYDPEYEFALFPIGGMQAAYLAMDAYDGSLDAAKSLHEAVLPGWGRCIWGGYNRSSEFAVTVGKAPKGEGRVTRSGKGDTEARAWLIAILQAALSEAEG